jgi:putative transposase
MPRPGRCCDAGVVQHVMNRANRRERIFHDDEDYSLFINVLAASTRKFPIRLLAYCAMPNHWHLVLWPSAANVVPAYMHWLTSTHVRHYHRIHGLTGTGHLYQGRYLNVPVQTDRHVLTVLRYVEANPLRAGMVAEAQAWRWSSLSESTRESERLTVEGPVKRPYNWLAHVNAPVEGVQRLRRAVSTGRPFGTLQWTRETAERYGLRSTLRGPGRPRRESVDTLEA